MKDWNPRIILVCLFLVGILFVVPAIMVGVGQEIGNAETGTDVPKMKITLHDITLDEIAENGKDKKYGGNELELVDGDTIKEFKDVEIKGRGNVTWGQAKKPLQIKLAYKADLLGLGKRRKWILLANYVDATNLRTDTAFYLEHMLEEEFAYDGEFVNLYIDNSYVGLYYLTRGIEINKNAVDLKNPLGILVELDNVYCKLENKCYTTGNGESFSVKDAVIEENATVAMNDFLTDFNRLEVAIKNNDYYEVEQLIDIESFAKYYLLSEFAANTDAYFTSYYFYKDGPEDKIHAGPAWDFDISLNNGNTIAPDEKVIDWINAEEYLEPEDQWLSWSRLFARLVKMPEFRQVIDELFVEKMMGHKDELIAHIEEQAAKIHKSALWDGAKWGKENFIGEVDRLVEWAGQRYDFFEKEFGKISE